MKSKKVALLGMLLAAMLVLGFVESLLPGVTGIPGVKLGLSNSVLLYAVYAFPAGTGFLLMLGKVLLSGVLYAGFSAMLYSLAGGILSFAGMLLVRRCRAFSVVGVSCAGGVLHNAGQMAVAAAVVGLRPILAYAPVLIIAGALTGVVTGIVARTVLSAWGKMQ